VGDVPANEALIRRFYDCFARGDAAGMNACYAPDIVFTDPVFGELRGDRARAMWTMLCKAMRDFSLTYEILSIRPTNASARCVASYVYSATGRNVRNEITTDFTFGDAAIVRQDDYFDLWKWSAQALGLSGIFLGWSPFVAGKIRSTAAERLERFINQG